MNRRTMNVIRNLRRWLKIGRNYYTMSSQNKDEADVQAKGSLMDARTIKYQTHRDSVHRRKPQQEGKLWKCSSGWGKHASDHTVCWGHRLTETEVPGIKATDRRNEMW